MAITESDYLHIHNGTSAFLLLRSPTHFHLVRIDANLTETKMAKLLRTYPCDSDRLRKLGLHFSAFKAEHLRGVLVRGYSSGDTIELWLRGDSRQYRLGSDYSKESLTAFFSGYPITHYLPPVWTGLNPKLIRRLTWLLNGGGIVCSIAFFLSGRPSKFWSILCMLFQFSALFLSLMYPESFTLAETGNKKHQRSLLPACIAPAFALALRAITDFSFGAHTNTFLLICLLTAPIPAALYIRISKAYRDGLLTVLGIILAFEFLWFGTVGQLNYLLDFDIPQKQIAQVTDMQMTRSTKSTDYTCTVLLPGGETMNLTLSGKLYQRIRIGEEIVVSHHPGAFHIPFSTVELLSGEGETE